MPNLSQLSVILAVFMLCMGVMGVLPGLFSRYGQRYRITLNQTARELNKFFIDIKPIKIIGGSLVVGGLLGYLTGSWVLALAIGLAGMFAPRAILTFWKQMRSTQFEAQLVDALILLGNAMKSGLDVAAGIELVSANMKPPISEEFGLVLNAYRLGTPLESALMDLTGRINSRTLETVVYAINIQRETGGNVIKTFDQLVTSIREESKLQKKVQALTAQGRTQIYFLAVFPWLLGLLFVFLAPDFMRPALVNPWGQLVLLGLAVWEVIGIFVTKKVVTVDV